MYIRLTTVFIFYFLLLSFAFAQKKDKTVVLNNILQSIPSPLEISSLIKETGVQYDYQILNPAQNVVKYKSEYKKALNLGIYSTDLGYINIYEKKDTTALAYLSGITQIADELKIKELIDFAAISKFAFSNNLNGLLAETSESFEKINEHLQTHQKAELSALILTGGWLETLYLTCQVAKGHPNKALDDRIAEQKIILGQILEMLNSYQFGPEMKTLISDFNKLNDLFKKVKIEQKTSTTENYKIEKWGNMEVLVYGEDEVKNTNTTKYKIEDLDNILKTSLEIRKKIVN